MPKEFQKFVISQVGILIRDDKCLILEDSIHPGKWELPGGRMDEGELSEQAFARELKEEIGIKHFENLGILDYDIWYPHGDLNRGVCALVFAINNNDDEIILSPEHLRAKWISIDEVDKYDYVWPNANRMIRKGLEYSTKNKRIDYL